MIRRNRNNTKRRLSLLGRGNNGAVLQAGRAKVYKWTVDPIEVQMALAVVALRGDGGVVDGFPEILDVRLGDREAVIVREDAPPLTHHGRATNYAPLAFAELRHISRRFVSARLHNAKRTERALAESMFEALRHPFLRSIGSGVEAIYEEFDVLPLDIRQSNVAIGTGRRDSTMLVDAGRAPLETLTVAPGEAQRRCPNESRLAAAVESLLKSAPSYGSCRIVGNKELKRVMKAHGWRDAEIAGTAGFHTEPLCGLMGCKPGDVLVHHNNVWSVLHELVHSAGIIDRHIATWYCEGITEACAQDIAAVLGIQHYPTYPDEVEIVRSTIAPALVEAGTIEAGAQQPPAPQQLLDPTRDDARLRRPEPEEATTVLRLGQHAIAHKKALGADTAAALQQKYGHNARAWYGAVGPGAATYDAFKRVMVSARKMARQKKAQGRRRR